MQKQTAEVSCLEGGLHPGVVFFPPQQPKLSHLTDSPPAPCLPGPGRVSPGALAASCIRHWVALLQPPWRCPVLFTDEEMDMELNATSHGWLGEDRVCPGAASSRPGLAKHLLCAGPTFLLPSLSAFHSFSPSFSPIPPSKSCP